MYGVINQSMKELLVLKFGKKAWEKVCEEAKSPVFDFVETASYPDSLTFNLAGAAARALSLDLITVLSEFGKHCLFAGAKNGHCVFNDLLGKDIAESLTNLSRLPQFLGVGEGKAPEAVIEVIAMNHSSYVIQCQGGFHGLNSILHGLVMGIAAYHDVTAQVTLFDTTNHASALKVKISQLA